MSPEFALRHIIDPALALLPPRMNSPEARAMLVAIALQESRFIHRRQIRGPARGFWQFETAGVSGVLSHRATEQFAQQACIALQYTPGTVPVYTAIEHNDWLAAIFARLNLWWLPSPLPRRGDAREGWRQYIEAWRPGKPHPETWDAFFEQGWEAVGGARR